MRLKPVRGISFSILSAGVLLVRQGAPPAAPPFPPKTISLTTFTSDASVAGRSYTYTRSAARDTTYYVNSDATQCCRWGAYGVDTSAGARQPFVLGTYVDPNVVDIDADVQPITQLLARFFRDPLHDPLYRAPRGARSPGNVFPAWMKVPAKTREDAESADADC